MKEIRITKEAYKDLVEMMDLMKAESFSKAIKKAKYEMDVRTAITFDGVGE